MTLDDSGDKLFIALGYLLITFHHRMLYGISCPGPLCPSRIRWICPTATRPIHVWWRALGLYLGPSTGLASINWSSSLLSLSLVVLELSSGPSFSPIRRFILSRITHSRSAVLDFRRNDLWRRVVADYVVRAPRSRHQWQAPVASSVSRN